MYVHVRANCTEKENLDQPDLKDVIVIGNMIVKKTISKVLGYINNQFLIYSSI